MSVAEPANFRDLTPLEERFVQEYLVDLNGSAACLRAGSTTRHPNKLASQMKARPPVRRAIDAAMSERARHTGITAEWVLNNLKVVAERCLQAVPVVKRGAHQEEDGQGLWSFDASGAIRSLELIGRHRGMFKDQVDHVVKGRMVHEHGLCSRSEAILEMLTGTVSEGVPGDTPEDIHSNVSSDVTSNIYSNHAQKAGSEPKEITGETQAQDSHEPA